MASFSPSPAGHEVPQVSTSGEYPHELLSCVWPLRRIHQVRGSEIGVG